MPTDDASLNQPMGNIPQSQEGMENSMEEPMNMNADMDSEMGDEMNDDMINNSENDETMEIINQLSSEDKRAVEAYAESLLKKNDNEETADESNMEQSMTESFIFTKKQLNRLMENFGPTNDELESKKQKTSKIEKITIQDSPFNSPKFK